MLTSIGSDNLLSAYAHVAHDVTIGDHTVLVTRRDARGPRLNRRLGCRRRAFADIHQFCRVGRFAMIGGYSVVTQDVLPFATTVSARENKIFGANRVGLERREFSDDVDRSPANRVSPLDQGRSEHESGSGTHPSRAAADRRNRRSFWISLRHRSAGSSSEVRSPRRQRPVPDSCARDGARTGHEIVAIGIEEEASTRHRSSCRRARYWISLGELSKLIDILEARRYHRDHDDGSGEAHEDLLRDSA